jgi:hypothetical protein
MRKLLPLLLLEKDLDGVLELCEPCPFFVDMLPCGFGTLSCYLSPCNDFMFLMEPLNLMLDSS